MIMQIKFRNIERTAMEIKKPPTFTIDRPINFSGPAN